MLLISILSFWIWPHRELIAEAFLKSGLGQRAKARRKDYLYGTIATVLANRTVYYSGLQSPKDRYHPSGNTSRYPPLCLSVGGKLDVLSTEMGEKTPAGSRLKRILSQAKRRPLDHLKRGRRKKVLLHLAALCRELGRIHQGAFALGQAAVGKLLNVDPKTISNYLRDL